MPASRRTTAQGEIAEFLKNHKSPVLCAPYFHGDSEEATTAAGIILNIVNPAAIWANGHSAGWDDGVTDATGDEVDPTPNPWRV